MTESETVLTRLIVKIDERIAKLEALRERIQRKINEESRDKPGDRRVE